MDRREVPCPEYCLPAGVREFTNANANCPYDPCRPVVLSCTDDVSSSPVNSDSRRGFDIGDPENGLLTSTSGVLTIRNRSGCVTVSSDVYLRAN